MINLISVVVIFLCVVVKLLLDRVKELEERLDSFDQLDCRI